MLKPAEANTPLQAIIHQLKINSLKKKNNAAGCRALVCPWFEVYKQKRLLQLETLAVSLLLKPGSTLWNSSTREPMLHSKRHSGTATRGAPLTTTRKRKPAQQQRSSTVKNKERNYFKINKWMNKFLTKFELERKTHLFSQILHTDVFREPHSGSGSWEEEGSRQIRGPPLPAAIP